MKKRFNLNKIAFFANTAAPEAPPAPSKPKTDPSTTPSPKPKPFTTPGFDPNPNPLIVPQPQNPAPDAPPSTLPVKPKRKPEEEEEEAPRLPKKPGYPPDPFKPEWNPDPAPRIIPDRQNFNWLKAAMAADDFHRDIAPGIPNTWRAIEQGRDPHRTPAAATDFVRRFGAKLARQGSHHAVQAVTSIPGATMQNAMFRIYPQLMGEISTFERNNRAMLEKLAESIAAKKTGLPKEMFKAHLGSAGQENPHVRSRMQDDIQRSVQEKARGQNRDERGGEEGDAGQEVDNDEVEMRMQGINDALESQLPTQFLAQGAGLNAMMEFEAIAAGLIDDGRIPPNIISAYHKLAKILSGCHFMLDFYGQAMLGGNMATNDRVEEPWTEGGEDEENGGGREGARPGADRDEDSDAEQDEPRRRSGQYKIRGFAESFPLLIYELVAGGIRISGMKNLDAVADHIDHGVVNSVTGSKHVETLGFQVGGALERKFKDFVAFAQQQYPHADYKAVLHTVFMAQPTDRAAFFKAISQGDMRQAMSFLVSEEE